MGASWNSLVRVFERTWGSMDVTRRAITFYNRDSTTGWRLPTYSTSTIKMLIIPRGSTKMIKAAGTYPLTDAVGLTNTAVADMDQVLANSIYYEIKAVEEIYSTPDTVEYYRCNLNKLPLWEAAPASATWKTSPNDPRERTKTWIDAYARNAQITKNDGSTPAAWATIFENPPYSLRQELRTTSQFQYYITGDDAYAMTFGANWDAQTFTVGSSGHTINLVKLKLGKIGSPGTFTVSIRATDGSGHPTGADLTSGSINANILPAYTACEWKDIPLTDYDLSANTKYAIVMRAPSGSPGDEVARRMDETSPTYAGGCIEVSTDSGSSWASQSGYDFMFEEHFGPVQGLYVIGQSNSTSMLDCDQSAYGYVEHVPIRICTVDGTDVTGTALQWKMEAELRYVFETYPSGTWRSLSFMRSLDHALGGMWLYDREYELNYERETT